MMTKRMLLVWWKWINKAWEEKQKILKMNSSGMLALSTAAAITSSSSSSSSSSPRTIPNEAVNANAFLMSKNLINTETLLLNELVLDLNNTSTSRLSPEMMSACSGTGYLTSSSTVSLSSRPTPTNNLNLKMNKYKLFAEQTDQVCIYTILSSKIDSNLFLTGNLDIIAN